MKKNIKNVSKEAAGLMASYTLPKVKKIVDEAARIEYSKVVEETEQDVMKSHRVPSDLLTSEDTMKKETKTAAEAGISKSAIKKTRSIGPSVVSPKWEGYEEEIQKPTTSEQQSVNHLFESVKAATDATKQLGEGMGNLHLRMLAQAAIAAFPGVQNLNPWQAKDWAKKHPQHAAGIIAAGRISGNWKRRYHNNMEMPSLRRFPWT